MKLHKGSKFSTGEWAHILKSELVTIGEHIDKIAGKEQKRNKHYGRTPVFIGQPGSLHEKIHDMAQPAQGEI